MLGDLDLKRISAELGGLNVPLEILFHLDESKPDLSREIEQTARQIGKAAGSSVLVKAGSGAGLPGLPALSLAYRGKSNIHYLGVPAGPEVIPFIEACRGMPLGAAGHARPWARELAGITQPAELLVFMATTCPNCPHAVRAAIELALVSYQVHTFVVDAQRYPELAESFAVKSVPTIVLDRVWTNVGVVRAAELAKLIASRKEKSFRVQAFASLVEARRLDDAAAYLKENAAPFFEAWKTSTTSTRMGLMLVAEKALELDSALMDSLVAPLATLCLSDDAALRGDTADLLGQIGHPAASEALERLCSDPNPDVAEIASEAIESIRARSVTLAEMRDQ
ncbi:MAG TPA: thioredoxin family protein [Myxococcota bacterium]|nr:thioredoxin family protein [Myxococcota bacterium]